MKKFIICLVMATTFISSTISVSAAMLFVDNQAMDLQLAQKNGVTFVPLRSVAEKAGLDVVYDEETKSVTIDDEFTHSIGSNFVTKADGTIISVAEPSYIEDGTTYVSIRLFSETLGYDVNYDENSKSIWIDTNSDINKPDDYTYDPSTLNNVFSRKSEKTDQKITTGVPKQSILYAHDNAEIILNNSTIYKEGDITENEYLKDNSVIILDDSSFSSNGTTIKTNANMSTGINASDSTINLNKSNLSTQGNSSDAIISDNTYINIAQSIIETNGTDSDGAVINNGITNIDNSNITTKGLNSNAVVNNNGNLGIKNSNITSYNGNAIESANSNITISNSTINSLYNVFTLNNSGNIDLTGSTINSSGNAFVINNGTENISLKNNSFKANNKTFINSINSDLTVNLENNVIPKQINLVNFANNSDKTKNLDLNLRKQSVSGNIILSDNTTADISLSDGSKYSGAINPENTAEEVILDMDASSSFNLTGNSYVSVVNPTIQSIDNINGNGYNLYYDNKDFRNAWLQDEQYNLSGGGKLIPTDSNKVIYLK